MGGYAQGFREHCPIRDPHVIAPADNEDNAFDEVSRLLPSLSGQRIVVVAINENAIMGAIRAAIALGRQGDLYYSGQGADPIIWREIACDPHYLASVAYFPEHYGETLIPAMIDILRRTMGVSGSSATALPAALYTHHKVVTAANIRSVYPATPPCDPSSSGPPKQDVEAGLR